jgi:hypothetical protein
MRSFVLFFALLMTTALFSQEEEQKQDKPKKLFLDIHAGGRIGGVHSEWSTGAPGLHMDGGLGYMLNDIWGLKGSLGYDQLNSSSDESGSLINDNSILVRANLEAVANISADRGVTERKMNYMFHVGLGLASQFHADFKDSLLASGTTLQDPLIKGNDDMLSIMFGITPQFKITNALFVEADLSFQFLPMADGVFDKVIENRKGKSMNVFMNPSIGISYHF